MINNLLNNIEKTEVTFSNWLISFISILFIRFLFELLSSPTRHGVIFFNPITLVHYTLFWTTLTLGMLLIIGHTTKDFLTSSKIALFGLPIIWLAPILDIIISGGKGFIQSYIFDNGYKIIINFLTFFGPNLESGATYGIRIEMIIVLIGIYLYLKYKKIPRKDNFYTIFKIYTWGFILASWPGILYTISHITSPIGLMPDIHSPKSILPDIYNFFAKTIFTSNISHNTLFEGISSVSSSRFFELGFDKLSSQILFLISTILIGIVLIKIHRNKFIAVVKNIRPERVGSYIALLLGGAGFAYINRLSFPILWIDIISALCLIISWISLWMYAVHSNDIEDIEIDHISNKERPLIQKKLDEQEMREASYIWLTLAIVGSFCVGFYPFFMSLVYIFTSHIYSTPPLRLRKFPLIPSFLIGVASLATILSGFFLLSVNKDIQTFPVFLSIGVIIMATLAINVKDIKDIEGDRKNWVVTLPIMFKKNGEKIVGLCFSLSFLLVPIFLSFDFLYIWSIPASIVGYWLVIRKPFNENSIFILRFIFVGLVGATYLYLFLFK
jgi:4-hydroxybenzoate polyprenyltransferase